MNFDSDHYQTLCVLPNAEHIVIVAAYRALAGQYHPDRWKGNQAEATAKMAEINVAYAIIGDPEKRKAYDDQRKTTHATFNESEDATDQAFDDAIQAFEDKWKTACDVFPDLITTRKNLEKTSHKLAFAFVVHLIENKPFKVRNELAQEMERNFLESHFGTNQQILDYAKELIKWGFKDAIKRLNEFVDVLGSDIESTAIIKRIENEFSLAERRKEKYKVKSSKEQDDYATVLLKSTKSKMLYQPLSDETFKYARLMGYEIDFIAGGFFKSDHYSIHARHKKDILFETNKWGIMCHWIKDNLA
jgi:curved DNA-binding protein CbpA